MRVGLPGSPGHSGVGPLTGRVQAPKKPTAAGTTSWGRLEAPTSHLRDLSTASARQEPGRGEK